MTGLQAVALSRAIAGDPPVSLVTDISLAFQPGKFTTIVGPSGCGKSSLLYLLGLLDRPSGGSLIVDGNDVGPLSGDERAAIRLRRFGFVFQFHFLLPEFTALENVLLPIRRSGLLVQAEAASRARGLLRATGLAGKEHVLPSRLSGGERQRVAIARALANDPHFILGDEPTGNLDSGNAARVVEIFRALAHDEGRTVICVTHDQAIAAASDVRVAMLDGQISSIEG